MTVPRLISLRMLVALMLVLRDPDAGNRTALVALWFMGCFGLLVWFFLIKRAIAVFIGVNRTANGILRDDD